MAGIGPQIVVRPGDGSLRQEAGRALARGATVDQRRRFARELEEGTTARLLDRLIEVAASQRTAALGSPDEAPALRLLSDDAIQRLGERIMERLHKDDRGSLGPGTELWESALLTEAALAFCHEAERRGLLPHEGAARLRAAIEGRPAPPPPSLGAGDLAAAAELRTSVEWTGPRR